MLVWIFVKISKRPSGERPSSAIIVFAILVSSVAFALLHLPALLTLGDPTAVNIAAALAANTIAGLVFGTVFAARGLESAMGAHAGAHVIGFALTHLLISS